MGFGEAIKTCFGKYATFSGRACRSEYWYWVLLSVIISFIPLVNLVGGLIMLIPTLAVGARRLHDIGKSGWWLLLGIIPIANLILIYFFIKEGEEGENAYGPNPCN